MSEYVNIYALYDSREPNHYRYIGQTCRSVNLRLWEHIAESELKRKKSKDYNTYKVNWVRKVTNEGGVVKARLLKTVLENKADVEETKIIRAFRSFGHKLTNLSMSAKPDNYRVWKSVECYDINGNFLGEFESIAKAARAMRLGKCGIVNHLKGRSTAYRGYIFTYKGDIKELNKRLEILNTQKPITKKIKYPKVGKNVVYVYDNKGNYIRFYRTAALAARSLNVLSGSITYAMKNNKVLNDKYYFTYVKKYDAIKTKPLGSHVVLSSVFEDKIFVSIAELCRYLIDNKITASMNLDTFRKSIGDKLNASPSHMCKFKSYVIYKKTTRGE